MKYNLQIENIKCGGCMNSIKKSLSTIDSIGKIEIDKENEIVSFNLEIQEKINEVIQKLKSMGYPEKGKGNLVDSAKSYVSCALGRLSKKST